MMFHKKSIIHLVFILSNCLMIILGCQNSKENEENPWEYDLSNLKKVESQWLTYSELEPVSVQLNELKALAVDDDYHIYVAGDSVIHQFNADHIKINAFTVSGSIKALSVFEGKIYVGLKNAIEVLSTTGKKIQSWEPLDRRALITSVVVTSKSVYIADAVNKQVLLFTHHGGFINTIAPDKPGFIVPSPYFDLAKDADDQVWVVNPGKHQILRIIKDGTLSDAWGKPSWQVEGFSGCCNPTHLAVLPDGQFVTSEKGMVRVKVYSSEKKLVAVAAEPQKFHESVTGLDLATDKEGRIYVLDPYKKQVRIFKEKE